MVEIKYKPIGIVHSPYKRPEGTPIQSTGAIGINGTVEVFQDYADGFKDLKGFSHIILLYHFHMSKESELIVKPYLDEQTHGVFATRAPSRPNPIGISVLRLVRVKRNVLFVRDIDIVDGTPVLDIKPYVPEFDVRDVKKIGWLEKNISRSANLKDNGRFNK